MMKDCFLQAFTCILFATAAGFRITYSSAPGRQIRGLQEHCAAQREQREHSFLKIVSAEEFDEKYKRLSSESMSNDIKPDQFGDIFQQCAPYIAMHRGSTMVVHIPDHCVADKDNFDAVLDDLSILHLLGVQLVLVIGVRSQLNAKLAAAGRTPEFGPNGMRVTDEFTMRCLMEVSGLIRFEIESILARGFRGRPGLSGINVVSGNFLYTAKPMGVRDGVDYKLTGEVRRIEAENINKRLAAGDICLMTCLGHSTSGEVFNVPSETLAADCAIALSASKVIYMTEGQQVVVVDTRRRRKTSVGVSPPEAIEEHRVLQNLRIADAILLMKQKEKAKGENLRFQPLVEGFLGLVGSCVKALNGGVQRAHLLTPARGVILKELFTRDGAGLLISRNLYEDMRQAQASDVRAIEEIIRPLELEGILVHRTRDQLEQDLPNCYVLSQDNTTLACGMLKPYSETQAEICCLAVHPSFRKGGRGEMILAYLERQALEMGITHLFLLSTRTMQWFEERGFVSADPSILPSSRRYDAGRNSKVYVKELGSSRDIDAEELL